MNKNKLTFSDKFQSKLGMFADKVNKNIYVMAVRDAMLAYMPFTFIGSIFLIIAFFPIVQVTDFITSIFGPTWVDKLLYVNNATIAIGGLIVVISLAKSLAEKLETDVLQCILTALVSFILLTPLDVTDTGSFISMTKIGAQAMFLGIIVSIVTVLTYKKIDEKDIKIKMPATVPPAVSKPFESIIPSFLVVTLFFVIRLVLELGLHTEAMVLINSTLGIPLTMVGGSVVGMVFIKIFEQFLWFFGLHGSSIVQAITDPIHQVLEDQNRAATIAGELPQNIINMSFKNHFTSIGIIGSIIAIILIAKSRQYKEVGKIAGPPYIFNIGEPTLFGVPLMLNVSYIIPFCLGNALSTVIAYAAFALHLVPIPTGVAQLPWTTPILISGYFVTGSISGALLQLVQLVACVLLWMPFVRMVDRKIYLEEQGEDLSQVSQGIVEKELETKEQEATVE